MEYLCAQVMASYGPKTSGQLLLSYGFAPSPQENPHDGCTVCMQISDDDALQHAKTEALQRYGLSRSQVPYPLKRNGSLMTWFPRRSNAQLLRMRNQNAGALKNLPY